MHPIHYSAILASLSIVGGAVIAFVSGQPWVFVLSVFISWYYGRETVGRFDDDRPGPEDQDDGPAIGFVQNR